MNENTSKSAQSRVTQTVRSNSQSSRRLRNGSGAEEIILIGPAVALKLQSRNGMSNAGYRSDESRVTAGQPCGGEWTAEDVGEGKLKTESGRSSALEPHHRSGTNRADSRRAPCTPGDTDTAISRANNLPLNTRSRRGGHQNGVYITHYGPGTHVGGWDPYNDSQTNAGIGNHNNRLNKNSLAISQDVARTAGLSPGDPVYINGQYLGNYDDTAPEDGRIDIYDPDNAVHDVNWGGMFWGANVTNHR